MIAWFKAIQITFLDFFEIFYWLAANPRGLFLFLGK